MLKTAISGRLLPIALLADHMPILPIVLMTSTVIVCDTVENLIRFVLQF